MNEITKEFVRLFNDAEDFYECHELFELAWKESKDPVSSAFYKAMVQVATSQFKLKKGLLRGVRKLHGYAIPALANLPPVVEGIDLVRLRNDLQEQIQTLPPKEEIGEGMFQQYDLRILKIHLAGKAETELVNLRG